MRKMSMGKRALSMALAIMLVIGLLPVSIFAAGTSDGTDQLVFATDRHANTTVIGNVLNMIEGVIGEGEIDYVGLGGDMVNDTDSYKSSTVLSEVTAAATNLDATNVDITYGSHDASCTDDKDIFLSLDEGSGFLYETQYAYVYGVVHNDMSDTTRAESAASTFKTWANGVADQTKVIIVLSHLPIHDQRNDNMGATYWHEAMNSVADSDGDGTVNRDVMFFHGHNHTTESNKEYFIAAKAGIDVAGGSAGATNYYTYTTAGYLNANNTATLVTITDSTITLNKYDADNSAPTQLTSFARATSTDSGDTDTDTDEDDTTTGGTTTPSGSDSSISEGVHIEGTDTTTNAYVYTATATADGSTGYILVSNGYALQNNNGSISAVAVTVTDNVVAVDSSVDISTLLWTIDSDGDVMNDGYYLLRASGSGTKSMTISTTDSGDAYSNWTYSNDTLTTTGGSGGSTTFYAYCSSGTFSTQSSSSQELKFYGLSEVTINSSGTYYLDAKDVTTTSKLSTTTAITLDKVISFVADGASTSTTVTDLDGEYTYKINEDTTGIIDSVSEDGVVTINKNVMGTAKVDVTYTWTVGDTKYSMTDTVTITVTEVVDQGVEEEYTTTITGKVDKTIYVLVDTPTAGNQYIIVSTGSAGTGYALKENTTTGTSVKINAATDSIAAPWIDTSDETIMWNATSGLNFKSENGGYYLNYSESSGSYRLSFSTSSASDWTADSSQLYREGKKNNYWLRYNSGWTMGSSGDEYNVYFYEAQTIQVDATVESTGTVSLEAGDPIEKVVQENTTTTVTLDPTILFAGEDATDTFEELGGTYTVEYVSGDQIISSTDGLKVNLNGTIGTAIVRVKYTWTANGTEYAIWDTVKITTKAPYYEIQMHYAELTEAKNVTADNFANGTYYTFSTVTNTYHVATEYVEGTTYYELPVKAGEEIKDIVALKGIEANDTYSVWAIIKYYDGTTENGKDLGDVEDSLLRWTISDESIATVDVATGIITFTGEKYGTFTLTAHYLDENGNILSTDEIVISVTQSLYVVPGDGTDDFPDYPNEGAIRHDKTATAVGNFSETGVAKVELSMTGVPYTSGSEIDVVLMLDMTGSMTTESMAAAEAAALAFAKQIILNTDNTYNDNRISVQVFTTDGVTELWALSAVTKDTYSSLVTAIESASTKQASGGTPYSTALQECYEILYAASKAEGYDRQQFCVFVSDGTPTSVTYITDTTTPTTTKTISFTRDGVTYTQTVPAYSTGSTTSTFYGSTDYHEYWSQLMINNNVSVYGVYTSAAAGSSDNNGGGSVNDTTEGTKAITNVASGSDKVYTIPDYTDTSALTGVFEDIAKEILAAATDVTVADKIGEDYTMIFDAPNAVVDAADGENQEYYIEITEYTRVPVYAADGTTIINYVRGTGTSLQKIYFGYNDTTGYYAATDANGTAAATPTFEKVTLGEKGTKFYWTTDASLADENPVSVVGADGTTYYFYSVGKFNTDDDFDATKWYNMTSGAYASGTLETEYAYHLADIEAFDSDTTYYIFDASTEKYTEVTGDYDSSEKYYTRVTSSTCQNMIIATPYFVYNAATKMLIWTVEEISSTELTLTYFLYLNNSGGFSGTDEEITPETYTTNQFAYVDYVNFQDTHCQLTFPVPQMTWNGAQVSYVFYLVNEAGQPVNRQGKVVPFSEAVYITDVFTQTIIWNDLEQSAGLEAEHLAKNLVPDVYELFDKGAEYLIHVYEDVEKSNLNNHFVINSSYSGDNAVYTTYVFNTKADITKYNVPGTYVADNGNDTAYEAGQTYLCKDYNVTGTYTTEEKYDELYGTYYVHTVTSATYTGTNTQWVPGADDSTTGGTVIDGYVYYVDEEGKIYTIVTKTDGNEVEAGFDFANTTVAFAVVWTPGLKEDTVVVDYGLDVSIDVITNDVMIPGVVGLGTEPIGDGSTQDTVPYTTQQMTATSIDLMIGDLKVGTASITAGDNAHVRVTFDKTNGMQLSAPISFYYEARVEYYDENDVLVTRYMYSKVTIIPATTVYYEDDFVTLTTETKGDAWTQDETSKWESSAQSGVQDVDRPGANKISADYDADNVYGYDSAYKAMSTYSMNKAAMVNVYSGHRAKATFTFYGTGFDIISLTSNTTGTITVKVEDASGNVEKTLIVDTYYGYAYGYCQINYLYTDSGWQIQEVITDTDKITGAETTDGDWPANPEPGVKHTVIGENWYPVSSDADNALYQIPVMKVSGLTYGQHKVTITAAYSAIFDHNQKCTCGSDDCTGCYNFYLDAIRIYDPTGNQNDDATTAYGKDTEGWPIYKELRNLVIDANTFEITETEEVGGIVFIDGKGNTADIGDYTNYGPNNELYLATGQSIAFQINDAFVNANNEAITPVDIQLAVKAVNGSGVLEMFNPGTKVTTVTTVAEDTTTTTTTEEATKDNLVTLAVGTATDMYYSIKALADGTIVISNTGTTVISITNIKFTFGESASVKTVTTDDTEGTEGTDGNGTSEASVLSITGEGAVMTLRSLRMYSATTSTTTVNEPETTEPETTEPESTEPKVTEPEATEPETTEPEVTEPEEEETAPVIPEEEMGQQVPENVKPGIRKPTLEDLKKSAEKIKNAMESLFGSLFG